MPRSSLHMLIWSEEQQHYELHIRGQLQQCFREEDEPAWLNWLAGHTSLAFQGRAGGRISVFKEARSRGAGYWYAYCTRNGQTSKRYLGRTDNVTFARLERECTNLLPSPLLTPLQVQGESTGLLDRRFATDTEGGRSGESCEPEQRITLCSTRFSHPRLPTSLVGRERLLRDLERGLSYRLILLSAPAGSGKTTLLSAWVTASTHKIAWLSLDELDNDPVRFWISVIASLHICLPKIGVIALAMLHTPKPPPLSTILTALLNQLLEMGREIFLVLDDYHVIEDEAIHESLFFFLNRLPGNIHLVLASRMDPPFPLSRLRVRGQLIEIRNQDLRFTRQEAASFLTVGMSLPLLENDVAILSERTEGWIAGLQLAALSMRNREDLSAFVETFAGNHRYLLDYVQEEIFARLPVLLQDFLLQTSILTSMNISLCQAVTATPEEQVVQEMLEELERMNLFVVPLDEQRRWYRFHDLFRQALLARLQARQPEQVPLLHRRAAHWYEAAGEWREAVTHALTAADYPFAASLIERAARQFWLRGEARIIHNWVLALPDVVLFAHAHLALNAALYLLDSVHLSTEALFVGTQIQVERTITRLEAILSVQEVSAFQDEEVALIKRRLRLLRVFMEARTLLKRNDRERMHLLCQEIEALPQDKETKWNMITLSFLHWLAYTIEGEGVKLMPRLLIAKRQMIEAGDYLAIIHIMVWLVKVYQNAGKLHQAHRECLEALTLVEQIGGYTDLAGYLHRSMYEIYYAWNRLEEASASLNRLLRIAYDWQQVDLQVIGEAHLLSLSLARGDMISARQALQKMEALVAQEGFANHVIWIGMMRALYWLADGNLAEAFDWAVQTAARFDAGHPFRKWEFLTVVHVYLARHNYLHAVEMLERFGSYFDRPGEIAEAVNYLVHYAIALHHSGKKEQAIRAAARLFSMTEPENYIRAYLSAGEPMRLLLMMLLDAPLIDYDHLPAISMSYVTRLLAIFEQEEQKRALRTYTHPVSMQMALPEPTECASSATQPGPFSPLSPQELRVLHLLVAGRTYAEMAEALIVSLNTIKTHVSSIYSKLGVSRRAEAIAAARRFQLL